MVKVLFVYYHECPSFWNDGLRAALKLLEKKFNINYYNLYENRELPRDDNYDFVLAWGAFGSPAHKATSLLHIKKGLCIAGNAVKPFETSNYDVLFYETKWYRPQIDFHKNITHAFGVNTDVFKVIPAIKEERVIDYLTVGAFSLWKRQNRIVDLGGNRMAVIICSPVISNWFIWASFCFLSAFL